MSDEEQKVNMWLIGDTIPHLCHARLPLALDVLKLFFYHQRIGHETIDISTKKVAKEIEDIWKKTAIPTLLFRNIILKIRSLKEAYEALRKSRTRRTAIQLNKEMDFKSRLNKIFEITSQAVFRISKEQQLFLEDQRGPRELETSSLQPLAPPVVFFKAIENSDSDHSNQSESDGSDFEDSLSAYQSDDSYEPRPKMLKTIINSSDVTSALDRVNMKNGEFTIVAGAIGRACGVDINRDVLSTSTIRRKRNGNRSIIVDNIKQDFFELLEKDTSGLVIHFDGKRLPNYTARNRDERSSKTERTAVVITGNNIEKLLGVVASNDGTGASTAKAVHLLLLEWDKWNEKNGKNKAIKIRDRIVGMAFDTTYANTGRKKGACKIFEEFYLKRKVLYFACRHHVYEVVVGGIFKKLFGDSTGRDVAIFERFKAEWKNIDKKKFKMLAKNHFKPFASLKRKETIECLLHALSSETTYLPRGDYREIMELCLLVLGHPLKKYTFKAPGPTHHARWMSKIMYSFKIYLFRDQFELTLEEKSNFEEMCLFAGLIYVKAWIQCPLTSDAPINDLIFFQELQQYQIVNKIVSETAIEKFENHLWYIGPELVVLSLFSNKVTPHEKRLMVKKIKEKEKKSESRGIRLTDTTNLNKKTLSDLIGCQSMDALKSLNLNLEFMFNSEPEKWCASKGYEMAKSIVNHIRVVNDPAERSLAMMTNYNNTLTRDEKQKQFVLQVVEDNRKRIKTYNKKNISTYAVR